MARHLVTGGAGFIGSHIAAALLARGDDVRVLDDLSGGKRENLEALDAGPIGEAGSGARLELVVGDVSNPRDAAHACEGVDGVFHEAALVSVPRSVESPDESFRINVKGCFEMLRAAHEAGVKSFVLASSAAIYGNDETVPKRESMHPRPVSPYAGDKLIGEAMLEVWGRSYGLKTAALRYFNVYGPRQADDSAYSGVIALFASKCAQRAPVTIFGDGEQSRDFVFVEDVAAANLLAMDADLEPGAVFNVGCGRSVTINELYRLVAERVGSDVVPEHGPVRAGDVKTSLASIDRIREALGFEPRTSLEEGLARTLDWYAARR